MKRAGPGGGYQERDASFNDLSYSLAKDHVVLARATQRSNMAQAAITIALRPPYESIKDPCLLDRSKLKAEE